MPPRKKPINVVIIDFPVDVATDWRRVHGEMVHHYKNIYIYS